METHDYVTCPNCKKAVWDIVVNPVHEHTDEGTFDYVTYSCPECDVILSVDIDPYVDIRERIMPALRSIMRKLSQMSASLERIEDTIGSQDRKIMSLKSQTEMIARDAKSAARDASSAALHSAFHK